MDAAPTHGYTSSHRLFVLSSGLPVPGVSSPISILAQKFFICNLETRTDDAIAILLSCEAPESRLEPGRNTGVPA